MIAGIRLAALLALVALVTSTSLANNRQSARGMPSAADTTLYERLGGIGAIEAMVDDLIARVTTDTVIMSNKAVAAVLARTDMQELRYHLVTRICEASGGPCEAPDEWPFETPANLRMTEAQWNLAVAHLRTTMARYRVPQVEQDALLAVVALAKRFVITGSR